MKTPQPFIGQPDFFRIFKNGTILLFCAVLCLTSCSQDEKALPEQQQKKMELENLQNDQPQKSTLAVEAKTYTEIMDSLYGKGNYAIATAVKISDADSDYYVKEVSLNKTVRGYLIDIDRKQDGNYENTVFLDHSVENTDNITYFNIKEGVQESIDLTEDPNYPDKIAFNPTEPPLDTFGRPFIGTVIIITWIQHKDGSWTKITHTTKYLCWIKTYDNTATHDYPPNAH